VADDQLTSKQAARLMGAGPSSIKRWAESGELPCHRTPGGHRRFRRGDVERLRAKRATRQAIPRVDDPEKVTRWLDLLRSEEDLHAVLGLLMRERAQRGAWHAVADGLGSVLAALGRLWERGELSVLEEHHASTRLGRALAHCAEGLAVAPDAPVCLLLCAAGDDHTLGLSLAELCLREAGWRALWSGRRTPLDDSLGRIRMGGLAMVAVAASAGAVDAKGLASEAAALAEACAEAGTLLALGGAGAWPESNDGLHRIRGFEAFAALLARSPD